MKGGGDIRLTLLSEIASSTSVLNVFGGLSTEREAEEGEFTKEKNLSPVCYPFASVRASRLRLAKRRTCYGTLSKDKIAEVLGDSAGTRLFYGGDDTGLVLTAGEKQLVSIGTKIAVFPDGAFYDTYSGESGSLSAEHSTETGVTVAYSLCRSDGTDYEYSASGKAPADPAEGTFWCDTSEGLVLKQYSVSTGAWESVGDTFVKISSPGIGDGFSRWDGVEISGSVIESVNGSAVLWQKDADSVVIPGIIDGYSTQSTPVTLSRQVPLLDFVCELDNRLWGCRRGLDRKGNFVNEICSSKLGDPFNWDCYMGLASDSYRASVGADGPFTGCIGYGGTVLFFKEDTVFSLRGTKPASFQIRSSGQPGVAVGCSRSLVTLGGVLYYMGRDGLMSYDGTYPTLLSEKVGLEGSKSAVFGTLPGLIYCYVTDREGKRRFLTYSVKRGHFHEEDAPKIDSMERYLGELLFWSEGWLWSVKDEVSDTVLSTVSRGEDLMKDTAEWSFETGDLCEGLRGSRVLTKLTVRMKADASSDVRIRYRTEKDPEWRPAAWLRPKIKRGYSVVLDTGRCDHVKLSFSGRGEFVLYSIARTAERAL